MIISYVGTGFFVTFVGVLFRLSKSLLFFHGQYFLFSHIGLLFSFFFLSLFFLICILGTEREFLI